ncbi:MAG: hypothetical protein R3E89_07115 [Thiolinea sp.]
MLLGFTYAWMQAASLLAGQLPAAWEGQDLQVTGLVVGLPEVDDGALRFCRVLKPCSRLSRTLMPQLTNPLQVS